MMKSTDWISLSKTYEKMHKDLQVKKKKHKIRLREEKIADIETDKMKLDEVIKELSKEKKLEEAKKLREELQHNRKAEISNINHLKKDIADKREKDFVLQEGDHVSFVDGEATGIIQRIHNKNAEILSGNMIMNVALSSLRPIKEQIEINGAKKINIVTTNNHSIYSSKLDIRGYKYEDAEKSIEEFLDSALLSNTNHLR